MKHSKLLLLFLLAGNMAFAQTISLPPSGDNQRASVSQGIGLVTVTINYNSPNVHGPDGSDRTGHIWGELVHYGFIDQSFGTSKSSPWRAGSNENTTITFSHPVKVNGQTLAAGTYGLFLDVEKDGPWNWIFSKNATSWGSYYYDAKEDALRAPTTPADAPFTEWLTYGFEDRQPNSTVAYLQWEKKRIPLKIEVPDVNEYYFAKLSDELRGNLGFDYNNLAAAAQFCAQNKFHLDQALIWAETAVSTPFIGNEQFNTLQTKASVLRAMNRTAEAEATMTRAINHPTASVQAVHQYGRSLLAEGQSQKAFDVFKLNRERHPEDKFTTYVGLARGYTAIGDKKNAIKNWETAIKNLPENQAGNKPAYEAELKKLKGGA
jgi:tetratricopeptide (TPR) repeat protein